MPIRKVTDPALLQQLGGPPSIANPMFPGQLQGQGLNNQGQALQNQRYGAELPFVAPKAAADATRSQIGAKVDAANAPADIATKGANARKSTAEAVTAERGLATTGGADTTESKNASFYTRAVRANQMYAGTGINDQPMGHAFAQAVLPEAVVNHYTSHARQIAESAQRDFVASTLRYESGAAISPAEFENQRKIYFPAAGDTPDNIAAKAQLRQNAIEGLKVASGPAGPMLDAKQGTTPVADYSNMTGEPQQGIAQGATRNEFDPQTSAAVDRLIKMGRPIGEIAAFAQQQGYPANPAFLASVSAAQKYSGQHPGFKGGFTEATRTIPTSLDQRISGSSLGAGAAAAGDAATLGFSDEAAGLVNKLQGGDYTQGRDAFNANKQLLADANPGATLAGTTLGSIAPFLGAGKALSLAGIPERIGATKASVLGDMAVGGAYGAGQDNENRLGGATLGALLAGGGNIAGRGLASGLASAISPTGGKLADLYAMGVRPSIGQRAGGFPNALEEKLQSIPLLGDAIKGTRDRARDQYQIGLFNDALGEIGHQVPKGMKPGHEVHAFAQDAFSKAYATAERGMTALPDSQFISDVAQLHKSVMGLRPESQKIFDNIWQGSVERRAATGSLTGEGYKNAMSEMSKKVAAIRKNPSGDHELADAFEEAMGAIRGSATRNSSPQAVAALDAADRGYAKLVRLEEASRKAGEPAEFSPTQYNTAVKTMSGGIRNRGYLRGDALNTDIAAVGTRLGDKVSNSGTVDRYAPLAALGGLGFVAPKAAAALGGYGLLNAPYIREAVTAAMAPHGGAPKTLADLMRKKLTGPAGTAGSALGLGLIGPR